MKSKYRKKAKYPLATIGSLTERGGSVTTVMGEFALHGLDSVRVGNFWTYPNRNKAVSTNLTKFALLFGDRPAELVSSSRSNGRHNHA